MKFEFQQAYRGKAIVEENGPVHSKSGLGFYAASKGFPNDAESVWNGIFGEERDSIANSQVEPEMAKEGAVQISNTHSGLALARIRLIPEAGEGKRSRGIMQSRVLFLPDCSSWLSTPPGIFSWFLKNVFCKPLIYGGSGYEDLQPLTPEIDGSEAAKELSHDAPNSVWFYLNQLLAASQNIRPQQYAFHLLKNKELPLTLEEKMAILDKVPNYVRAKTQMEGINAVLDLPVSVSMGLAAEVCPKRTIRFTAYDFVDEELAELDEAGFDDLKTLRFGEEEPSSPDAQLENRLTVDSLGRRIGLEKLKVFGGQSEGRDRSTRT